MLRSLMGSEMCIREQSAFCVKDKIENNKKEESILNLIYKFTISFQNGTIVLLAGQLLGQAC